MHSPNFKSVSIFLLVFLCLSPLFGTSLSFSEAFLFLTSVILLSFYYFTKSKYIVLSHFLWILALTIVGLFVLTNSRSLAISYYAYLLFITIFIFSLIVSPAVNLAKLKNLLILSTTIYIVPFLAFKLGFFGLKASSDGDDFIFISWGKSHLAELIIFIFPLVIQKISGNKKYLFLIACFLPILYLTSSRSAIFALTLGLIYLLKNNYHKFPKLLFPIIVALPITFFILQFSVENKLLAYKSPTGARFEYWQQALLFFKESPLLGNGQNTFFIANKLWQTSQGAISTNNPHNLTLKLLSESGIIFTLIFYLGFFYLWKNSHDIYAKTSVLILFIESQLGTSLSNIGLQILVLVFLFSTQSSKPRYKIKNIVIVPFLLLMLITSLSRLSSDLAFFSKNYSLSMTLDPFNVNALYESLRQTPADQALVQKIIYLGRDNYETYSQILNSTNNSNFEKNTQFLDKFQSLNSQGKLEKFTELTKVYLSLNDTPKLNWLLSLADSNGKEMICKELFSNLNNRKIETVTKSHLQYVFDSCDNGLWYTQIKSSLHLLYDKSANIESKLMLAKWLTFYDPLGSVNNTEQLCKQINTDDCKMLIENIRKYYGREGSDLLKRVFPDSTIK